MTTPSQTSIKVYTTTYCPYCIAAKELFKSKNIDFQEINLSDSPEKLQALKDRTGMKTVPQIFIGEKLVGGFTELNQLDESGELEKKINA